MTDEELHIYFLKAIEAADATDIVLPTDIKLRFYAHYKRAIEDTGFYRPSDKVELRNAFKINALFQVKRLSKKEAKLKYIELVKTYLNVDVYTS